MVVGLDGLAREPVVAGNRVGDEGLDPGVADVLELLVVRAVHVRLVSAEAGGAPSRFPDLRERRVARVEASLLRERVAGGEGLETVDDERLVRRLHVDLQEPPGPPPERLEDAASSPVGQDEVGEADEALAFDLVSVALGEAVLDEGFLVAEAHLGPPTPREGQARVGGHQLLAVEQDRGLGPRGDEACRRQRAHVGVLSIRATLPADTCRYSMGGSSSGTSQRPSGVSAQPGASRIERGLPPPRDTAGCHRPEAPSPDGMRAQSQS